VYGFLKAHSNILLPNEYVPSPGFYQVDYRKEHECKANENRGCLRKILQCAVYINMQKNPCKQDNTNSFEGVESSALHDLI